MDNQNITMEEYIRLEEEKARRRGKVYNLETATYGKIWYDDDIHDLRSVETEFPAIIFNDELTYEKSLSCEPTVSSLNNNKIDFRYRLTNPTMKIRRHFYNDTLTSKSDSSTEPVEIPHRINEFDLKTETLLSECDGAEQNVVYFNDLFPFNKIYPDDLESDKDNDDNEIDMALPPRDQRHQYLKFEGLQYTDADIVDFETRLGKIYSREVHRVLVLDFESLTAEMAEGLTGRILMEHRDAQGQSVFTSCSRRRLFEVRGPLVFELIVEFLNTFRFGEAILDIDVVDTLQLQLGGARRRMS
ncbi:hypothetical protein Tco_1427803 [Tanacetum coccineum]